MPSMFADRGNRFTHKVMALVLAAVLIVLGVIGVVLPAADVLEIAKQVTEKK